MERQGNGVQKIRSCINSPRAIQNLNMSHFGAHICVTKSISKKHGTSLLFTT